MIARFAAALFSAFALLPFAAGAANAGAGVPAAVPIFESNAAAVAAIRAGNIADLVVVDAGYDRDFCTGARCSVERAGVPVAEVIIAAASRTRAVALITQFETHQTIQTGDTVKLKTI